jgi:hypothetical protein
MFFAYEKPIKAIAVRKTLIAVTLLVPNFFVILSDIRLEIMVPPDIIIDSIPINDIETPISWCITGQAEPSNESGNPKLIKAIYIKTISSVYICTSEKWHITL